MGNKVDLIYPKTAEARGPGFWLQPANIWASRGKFLRMDFSNEWRYDWGDPQPPDRSVFIGKMLPPGKYPAPNQLPADGFNFVILGDTGEGDHSQYGLVPLIRTLNPDFLLINGDTAYPAGRIDTADNRNKDDFLAGFFEPYRDMGCQIWATMGNHEYYSDNNGREFHDTFCTSRYDKRWSDYGLRHDPRQPGTYWELDDLNGPSKLVILGLDSGKNANLDGDNDWWQFWKRHIEPDSKQHDWLDSRLDRAQRGGGKVIILFHIPALVKGVRKEEYLNTLHKTFSRYPCVKAVIAAHEHNFQLYTQPIFQRYLEKEELQGSFPNPPAPWYIVAGSSGASLESTKFDATYPCTAYPTGKQWDRFASAAEKTMATLKLDKTLLSDLTSRIIGDPDLAVFLTALRVEVHRPDAAGNTVKVTPVFLDDVNDLFGHLPPGTTVDVMSKNPPVGLQAFLDCLQTSLAFEF